MKREIVTSRFIFRLVSQSHKFISLFYIPDRLLSEGISYLIKVDRYILKRYWFLVVAVLTEFNLQSKYLEKHKFSI